MSLLDRLLRVERIVGPPQEEYDPGVKFTHHFFLNGMARKEIGREMTPKEALLWFTYVRENGLDKFLRGIREICWYNWKPGRDSAHTAHKSPRK